MAYMNQEKKSKISAAVAAVVAQHPEYGLSYTLSVHNHSTIVMTIKTAAVDLIGHIADHIATLRVFGQEPSAEYVASIRADGYRDVNVFHLDNQFPDADMGLMIALVKALDTGNWNRSDLQSDYFDVGHYVTLHIGRWNKPFQIKQAKAV
jgi:hypothetical protein